MVATVGAGQLRLVIAAHGADDRCAEAPRPLTGDQPNPARSGMEQNDVARLHPISAPQQVLSSHALQHHRGGGLIINRLGQRHHPVGGDQPDFGVSADRRAGVGHPVADLEFGHARADRFHPAGAFHAQRPGQRRQGIQPGAVIDIDIVEANRALPDADLAGTRIAHLDLFPAQCFRAAVLMNANGFGHGVLLVKVSIFSSLGEHSDR